MKINEIIRQKRKELNLTQEQVAESLGVSTPAVNKWEKGSTYPDITTLPALARLLRVDLNTLLSFDEELTDKEIGSLTNEVAGIIQQEGFCIGFDRAMAKIQEFPTCDLLIYSVALTLEGALFMFGMPENVEEYKSKIEKLYERVADSENIEIRNQANSMLISKYMEREEYEKAQSLLDTLPAIPFDKTSRQAQLYVKQGRTDEAAQLLETKLMSMAGEMQSILVFLMDIALKENKSEVAEHLAETAANTTKVYDLWDYNAYSAQLQLAITKKDEDKCIELLRLILSSIKKGWDIEDSMLYQHIKLKEQEQLFGEHLISGLLAGIQNDEDCVFLRNNPKYLELVSLYQH